MNTTEIVMQFNYLRHFSLNKTPPPARKPSPKHAADVAITSPGESNNFVRWNRRYRKNRARWLLCGDVTDTRTHTHPHTHTQSTLALI